MISSELYIPQNNVHMVQYGVWPDCTNNCEFCLRMNRTPYSKERKLFWLKQITENIKHIDWSKFSNGVSLLGGELYYIRDKELQTAFMELIDTIIEYVLIPGNENTKYSTVTNGIYKPDFLYKVIDHIRDRVGMQHIDINFSYDIKYRYRTEASRQLALSNINAFHKRYNYRVGVQMILTQYVIDLWKAGQFDINQFIDQHFPGCTIGFLYPHPIHTKTKHLSDFNFKRFDFLQFLSYLKSANYEVYLNFVHSTKNSGTFKYTGLRDRLDLSVNQQPILSDGKEEVTSCGHSILYRCYADSDKCMLCDILQLEPEL